MGLLPNSLVASGFVVAFSFLLCARLDGSSHLSFFVVLIPVWIFLLYFCLYLVLVGLASKNYKVNKSERLVLSLLMPLGFMVSTVLSICYAEGNIRCSLGFLYIPQACSFGSAYLYVRCLVSYSKRKIANEPSLGPKAIHN
jgi:hypothetical protein